MAQENELEQTDALYSLSDMLEYSLQSRTIQPKKFHKLEAEFERLRWVLGRTYLASVFLEPLRRFRSLEHIVEAAKTMPMEIRRSTFLRPLHAALRHRARLFPQRYRVPPTIEDAENVKRWLEELEAVSKRLVEGAPLAEDCNRYKELRRSLSSVSTRILPHSVRAYASPQTLAGELRRESPNPVELLTEDFRSSKPEWSEEPADDDLDEIDPPIDENEHHSGDWTGRRTVREQVQAIRQFVPLVMEALDQLIDLYEKIGDNRGRTKQEQDALDVLRSLHSQLATLLAAVEAGKPFAALLKTVRSTARRAFGIANETKELLIAGTPAIAAAGITSLAALKGLELSGVEVGISETAAALGLTGTIYGAHSVKKK